MSLKLKVIVAACVTLLVGLAAYSLVTRLGDLSEAVPPPGLSAPGTMLFHEAAIGKDAGWYLVSFPGSRFQRIDSFGRPESAVSTDHGLLAWWRAPGSVVVANLITGRQFNIAVPDKVASDLSDVAYLDQYWFIVCNGAWTIRHGGISWTVTAHAPPSLLVPLADCPLMFVDADHVLLVNRGWSTANTFVTVDILTGRESRVLTIPWCRFISPDPTARCIYAVSRSAAGRQSLMRLRWTGSKLSTTYLHALPASASDGGCQGLFAAVGSDSVIYSENEVSDSFGVMKPLPSRKYFVFNISTGRRFTGPRPPWLSFGSICGWSNEVAPASAPATFSSMSTGGGASHRTQ
jgi:hypothetical protein